MKISLESLLLRLVNKGTTATRQIPMDASTPTPTSIRLKASTKHFLECQADALNTSVQSLINIILDGVAETTTNDATGTLRTIRERFLYLFQAHKIDFIGIISIMKDYGFTLSILDNPARTLDLIDKKTLTYLSQLFFVRIEWISGTSDSIIPGGYTTHWYKNPYGAAKKIMEYATTGQKPHVCFLRRHDADFEKASTNSESTTEPIGLAIQLTRKIDETTSITVYEVWEIERWNYQPCRDQIKLLIAFCDQANRHFSYVGYSLSSENIDALIHGRGMPVEILDRPNLSIWFPDAYACIRDKVTKEIEDWPRIQSEYERAGFDKLILEATPLW